MRPSIDMSVSADRRSDVQHVQQNVYLRSPVGPAFQAPPLPGHFVARPTITNSLIADLTRDSSGVLVVSAIHGLGGIGKSTLAADLAGRTSEQFKDGVLWATIGQEKEEQVRILSLLSGWIQALGDYEYRPTTIEAATNHLRTLLHDKAVLLILDDIWFSHQIAPFLVGGPNCRVLITTRRANVADDYGARLITMDVMSPEESLTLLAERLKRPLDESEAQDALRLADSVGYLPLALDLAAARVARGASWDALIDGLQKEVAELEKLENPQNRQPERMKLHASFNFSLEALRLEDEALWRAFIWLGVLPEDVLVLQPMMTTLWDVGEGTASRWLEVLWNDALLLPGPTLRTNGIARPTYRIHDLIHDVARRLLVREEPDGLGITLANAHAALLDRYWNVCEQNSSARSTWCALPDDGYIDDHLLWHLSKAGRVNDVHALMAEETDDNRNSWFLRRTELGEPGGYLADVTFAWHLAEKEDPDCLDDGDVGLQLRYALITASLYSLAGNIKPELLAASVELEKLSLDQALLFARQTPDLEQRAQALLKLSANLPRDDQDHILIEAIRAAEAISNEGEDRFHHNRSGPRREGRASVIRALVDDVPDHLLPELVASASSLQTKRLRIPILNAVVARIGLEYADGIIKATDDLDEEWLRSEVLCELATRCDEANVDRITELAWEMDDDASRCDLLAALVPRYLNRLSIFHPIRSIRERLKIRRILQDAAAIPDLEKRPICFAKIVDKAPSTVLLRRAMRIARESGKEWSVAAVAGGLARHISEGLAREWFKIILELNDEHAREHGLVEIIPHLPYSLLEEAWTARHGFKEQYADQRVERLVVALCKRAEGALLDKMMEEVDSLHYGQNRRFALLGLADRLEESLLDQAAKIALASRDNWELPLIIRTIAVRLTHPQLRMILATIPLLTDPRTQADVIEAILPNLPQSLFEEATSSAKSVSDLSWKARALANVAATTQDTPLFQLALDVAIEVDQAPIRARTLTAILSHLPKELKSVAVERALEAAQVIGDVQSQYDSELGLFPYLSSSAQDCILDSFSDIEGLPLRAEYLAQLAAIIDAERRIDFFRAALDALGSIENQQQREEVLRKIAPQVPDELLEELWNIALAFSDDWKRRDSLKCVIPLLPQTLLVTAGDELERISDGEKRASLEVEFYPRFIEFGLTEHATKILNQIEPDWGVGRALSGLSTTLSEQEANEAAVHVDAVEDEKKRAEALVHLAVHLPQSMREEGLVNAISVAHALDGSDFFSMSRGTALAKLAPHLVEHLMESALQIALSTQYIDCFASSIQKLAPFLSKPLADDLLADVNVRRSHFKIYKEQALSGLLPRIAELGEPERALNIAREIQHDGWRARALVGIAPHIRENESATVLDETLATLAGLAESSVVSSSRGSWSSIGNRAWQIDALEKLATLDAERVLPVALQLLRSVQDEQIRTDAMRRLAPIFDELEGEMLLSFWNSTLHDAAVWGRACLLSDIQLLSKVIVRLGSDSTAQDVYLAIREIRRWWP